MKMLPATANAMYRNALSSLITSTQASSLTNNNFAIMLFTGTAPTKAELDAYYSDPTQLSGANARYLRSYPLLSARQSDYVGGIAGIKPVVDLTAKNVTIAAGAAMATKLITANSDNRNCYFAKDATPTWFVFIGSLGNTLNLSTGLPAVQQVDTVVLVGSVGDENSSADLKLVGGKVFANNTTPTDQSKAVIINDLVLKFA